MSTQSSTRAARRPNRLFTLLVVVLGLFGAGILVLISVRSFGYVQGEEFSPDTFQSRNYHFYQVPLLRIQVSPVFYTARTSELTRHLLAQGWIVASGSNRPRWDLVYRRRGPRVTSRGNAEIVVNYLELRDREYSLLWKDWSDDHPELAQLLWPTIAELARGELYMFVPEVLQCAQEATDPNEFQEEMRLCLARQYAFLGATLASLGDQEQANDYFTKALEHDPNCTPALRGQAEASHAAGSQPSHAAGSQPSHAAGSQPSRATGSQQ